MTTVPEEHKADAPETLNCAVITVSDTRTIETDTGGRLVVDKLIEGGHQIAERQIIPDEPMQMRPLLERMRDDENIDVVLITGGTGISSRDLTFETVTSMITKPLPGYGELFRMLSFAEIGAAAILSRATGGLMHKTVVMTMPGSRAAVKLAMDRIILPELTHVVRESRR